MVTVFEQGDIVYMDFDPQAGHEQRGRRPALVISNNLFNRINSLTMVCPITHTDRGSPFPYPPGPSNEDRRRGHVRSGPYAGSVQPQSGF